MKKYIILLMAEGINAYSGSAPEGEKKYVVIQAGTQSDTQGKGAFNSEVSITLECVCKGSNFGFKDSEELAGLIMDVINSDINPSLAPDFQVITTRLESSNNIAGLNTQDNVYRTILRYSHKITQL